MPTEWERQLSLYKEHENLRMNAQKQLREVVRAHDDIMEQRALIAKLTGTPRYRAMATNMRIKRKLSDLRNEFAKDAGYIRGVIGR
jgi:hypothetical protein